MKNALFEMLAKSVGSRKAASVVAGVIVNMIVILFLRFGVDLDDTTKASIVEAVSNVSYLVIVYVAAQGGIDLVEQLKKEPDE